MPHVIRTGPHAFALIAATLAALPLAAAEIGTVAAVNRDMTGTPPSSETRPLELGASLFLNERVETSRIGSGQLVFADQTTLSVAPNTDIVLDEYVYDPGQQTGTIVLSMTKGALRFIGGRITKGRDAIIRTPTATVGIRGGLCLVRVSETGVTEVIQIAGEYTQITDVRGGRVTLSRPNASAAVKPDGKVAYTGLVSAKDLSNAYGAFEGKGDGGGNEAAKAPAARREAQGANLATVNSGVARGEARDPVSTSGEKHPPAGGPPKPPGPPKDVVVTGDDTTTGGGTTTPTVVAPIPSAGSFFMPSTGLAGFNAIALGSLIGSTPGGQLLRIPVPETPADFVAIGDGRGGQVTFFAQSINPNSGFFQFDPASGAFSSSGGFLSGFGFSDLDNNFHLYEFDTEPAGGAVEHGIVVFGDPSAGQAAVMLEDNGSLPISANTAGVYVIEKALNELGEDFGTGPAAGLMFIANGGEARFEHASTSLPANGGRVMISEVNIELDPFTGEQLSGFSTFVTSIEGSATGGLVFGGQIFDTESSDLFRGISVSNVGTFEDLEGNTVFGANDDYIVVSSLHRPGGIDPYVFDPGFERELGQPAIPNEPFVNLLTHDAGLNTVALDPLPLAATTSRAPGALPGTLDQGFATGFAACSTGNCGTQLTSSAFSGVYALQNVDPADVSFAFNFGQFGGPDDNSVALNFITQDVGFVSNAQGAASSEGVAFGTGPGSPTSAYLDDDRFALTNNGPVGAPGLATIGNVAVASSGLTGDGGLLSGAAGAPPEFLRWGWWSAEYNTIDATTGNLREDLVHMGTWVAGVEPDLANFPTTGTAAFSGFAVGTDADLATGITTLVGGDFSMTYDFGASLGQFAVNIAGHAISNVGVFGAGPVYSGFDSAAGLEVNGAFFAGGGSATAATGGSFRIDDVIGNRQVIGVFGGDKL